MIREIKFRGIKKETKGEWVYGGYFSCADEEGLEHFIFQIYYGGTPVYEHTVSQFTGLKDRNKVDVYVGDIIEYYGGRRIVVNTPCDGLKLAIVYEEPPKGIRQTHENWSYNTVSSSIIVGNILEK
jgi:hypothetical protein